MRLKVTFLPEERETPALPGMTLLELAREANIALVAHCAGNGTCGKCRVIVDPAPPPNAREKKILSPGRLKQGYRLACQVRVGKKDLTVKVPSGSRLLNLKSMATVLEREISLDHPVRKYLVSAPVPGIDDQESDWERFRAALAVEAGVDCGSLFIPLSLLRLLPGLARKHDFCLTFTLSENGVIDVEGGDTTGECFGVAVDLGTTSIAGVLVDLGSAGEKALADAGNPQSAYGADVISRINFTLENEDGLEILADRVAGQIDELITLLCRKAGIASGHVYQVALAGNTVMEHLFARLPPFPLANSPYVGVCRGAIDSAASDFGLRVPSHARVYLAPMVSGYVGGDTVAGIIACNQHRENVHRLFVDIGTNGEIVVGGRDGLWCAATAAGPAFEGATIHHGMRAEPGAIDKVRLAKGRVELTTVGEEPARGICGTGLIAAVSEMCRIGLLTPAGKFVETGNLEGRAAKFSGNFGEENGQVFFRLCEKSGISLYQKDVRQVQLAKAAIATGIDILLGRAGLKPAEIKETILAGAFGSFIEPIDAIQTGMLPEGLDRGKIIFAGNTALVGARMMLLSGAVRREAARLSERCRHVELFREADFMEKYAGHLFFPENTPSGRGREPR